jgi:hypothetical protein
MVDLGLFIPERKETTQTRKNFLLISFQSPQTFLSSRAE